jgi:hypothetical protein
MAIDLLKEYLVEYASSILFFSGFLLLVVGVLLLETFGSILSAASLFFGIVFVAWGLLMRLGFFYMKLHSLDGLGTILLSASVVFLALSIAGITILQVKHVYLVSTFIRGNFAGYYTILETYRPYASLAIISLWAFIVSLLAGVIVKIYSGRR